MKTKLNLKALTVNEITDAVNGRSVNFGSAAEDNILGICTSSSEAEAGFLFVAIKGARADGHEYISDAVKRGAVAAIVDHIPEESTKCRFTAIVVDDTVAALGRLASKYRTLAKLISIAVTGSVGKTTTKEFISAVTSAQFPTHKSEGNHNNEIGMPMSLLGIGAKDKISVAEMGMSSFGEIEHLSKIALPDIAVITNIGVAHIANLGSRENICHAKLEITAGMNETGLLLYNADEPLLTEGVKNVRCRVRSFSLQNRAGDYRALNIRTVKNGMMFDIIYRNKAVTNVEIPTLGRHNVYNALIAFAVGAELGMTDELIRRGLSSFRPADQRQSIYSVKDITVIDDCYNASPESMKAALDVLTTYTESVGGRAIALLGDMLELGDYSKLMHEQLGMYAAQANIKKLFCYGSMADTVAESAIKRGIRASDVYVSEDTSHPEIMADMILSQVKAGDVLLVKASRGVAAENVIKLIKESK